MHIAPFTYDGQNHPGVYQQVSKQTDKHPFDKMLLCNRNELRKMAIMWTNDRSIMQSEWMGQVGEALELWKTKANVW